MIFEGLANELFLELFQYFNFPQLFRAFQSLNSRFDHLLYLHLQNFRHLDFRSISKHDFQFICQHHLRSIAKQILSLILSNNDETPQLTDLFFFSHHFHLRHFPSLQSLSFYQMNSQMIIETIASDLPHLTHLNFIDCSLSSSPDDNFYLINNLWKLPKLIHLQLHITHHGKIRFISPNTISSSIEYISIKNLDMTMNDIYHLLTRKPALRHVKVYTHLDDEDINVVDQFPSMIRFELYDKRSYPPKIYFTNHIPRVVCLLRAMPNLHQLTIETPFIFLDGYRWKCFINNFLPKLKIFRLKMSIYFNHFAAVTSRVDYIFNSFQSAFWIDEHPWFIRCHWNTEDKYSQCILFYTWPYTFSYLSIPNHHQWSKSTCPLDDRYWSSSYVHHLSYNSLVMEGKSSSKEIESKLNSVPSASKMNKILRFNTRKTRSFSLSDENPAIIPSSLDKTVKITSINPCVIETSPILHFPNIQKLTIQPPFDDYFWWMIPKLHRLISLTIKSSTQHINPAHLQTLLDRAPRLYSLTFHLSLPRLKFPFLNITSQSIRRLDLKGMITFDQCPFLNHEQCIALTRSSLGQQCQVLLIGVRQRRSIVFLIHTMLNLRALNVRCQDDQSSLEDNDLLPWLQTHLSSTITIERTITHHHDLRFWIR